MKYSMAFALLAGLLAGCVSSGTEVTSQQAAQFVPGVTTEANVVAKLGEPNSTATAADGTTSYSYVHYAGGADAADYIPVVGLLAGGTHGTSNTRTFNFDRNGLLLGSTAASASLNSNTGLINQR